MLKEFIDKILGLSVPNTIEHNGGLYADKKMYRIEAPMFETLQTNTLQSILDYLESFDENSTLDSINLAIHIIDPETVSLITECNPELRRSTIMTAKLHDSMRMTNLKNMTQEEAIIKLQTYFEPSENLKLLLKVVGNIVKSGNVEAKDDGVSQEVIINTGTVLKDKAQLPNPIELVPRRTFREVEQPASMFAIRVNKDMAISLFEAGGNMWQIEAIENIRAFFESHFKEKLITDQYPEHTIPAAIIA